jgi:hypothetical protein
MPPNEHFVPQHGSDTGAMMWWGVPLGFLESRSLLEQKELPLWNRYGRCGDPLIGQGVAMLGDPLQLIVIFGRGSALASDLKFLAAKLVFCLGFGFLTLRLLGSRPLSLLYAALAAYCGAFFYIASHPVFFVLAYAPLILLSTLELLDLECRKPFPWLLLWIIANVGCFSGGHLEVAVDVIAGLNLAGLADAIARQRAKGQTVRVLLRMAVASLLFLGVTAPIWVSFLVALQGAFSVHNEIQVLQHSLASLPGAFDDEFFRGISRQAPGTSLLVMTGVILSAFNWREFKQHVFYWVNSVAIVLWGGCVFGWIPGSVLACIPLWNRVGHLSTDISYLLVIHLTVQSSYGFKSLAQASRKTTLGFLCVGLIFSFLLLQYSFLLSSMPFCWYYFLCAGIGGIGAPLLYSYLKQKHRRISAVAWSAIILLGFIAQHRFGLYTFGNKLFYMVPGPRVQLDARSESIERIKRQRHDPFRVVGLNQGYSGSLSGEYSLVYGLEDIRSCAPLGNGEFVKLLQQFPGIKLTLGWVLEVQDALKAHALLNMLNVGFLMTTPGKPVPSGSPFRRFDESDFLVLDNPEAWPRAFFCNQVTRADSIEQFTQKLLEAKGPFVAMPKEQLEGTPALQKLEVAGSPNIIRATDYKLLPNSTQFNVHAESAGIVCLTEGQAKDFTAKVNDEARNVLTVNRAFKGVYVDKPGDYEVVFTYRPRYWAQSCAAFWASMAGLIVISIQAALSSRVPPDLRS